MIYTFLISPWIGVQGMGCGKTRLWVTDTRKYMLYLFRFIDHLMVMFGETPSWDLEQKYCPDNLEVRKFSFVTLWELGLGEVGWSKVSLPFKKKIVGKYKTHKIYLFKHFKVYGSIALSASTLYNHYHHLSLFSSSWTDVQELCSSSLSLNGPTLGASCKWSHRVFVLLHLA